jgi:hypothetical protein
MVGRRLLPLVLVAVVVMTASPAFAAPGDTLWTKTYDGPGSTFDSPAAMVVDPDHYRVYVVGTSVGDGTGYDIVTIAYDLYTGAKIWARRYDGPAHGSDYGVAIAYNPYWDSVVVAGSSETVQNSGWLDTVTISYLPDGSRQWAHRLSLSETSLDMPAGLVVYSGSTYVLVGGTDHGALVKYNPDGVRVWRQPVTDRTLATLVDLEVIGGYLMAVGTTYITDASTSAFFTTCFREDGTRVWTKRFSGRSNHAYASDAAVGTGGTILYVTGGVTGGGSRKIVTLAYEPHDGYRFWRRSIAPQSSNDVDGQPYVAVSPDGSKIVVAATSYLDGIPTFLTRQYNGDGSVDWTARENGVNESSVLLGVAIGATGIVFVVGGGGTAGARGPLTVAYPPTGPPRLFEAPITPVDLSDAAVALTPGPFGDVVYVGSRYGGDLRVDAYAAY